MTRAHPILNPDFGKKVVRLVITVVGLLILRATLDALSTAAAQKSWVGFANGNVAQDRDADLRRNCGDFKRVYVPEDAGNRFTDLCGYLGETCAKVCDWQGNTLSCDAVSQGGNRDGTRLALCRSTKNSARLIESFGVGSAPVGIAFDGANIWVVNNLGNTVTKIRARDGIVLGTFRAGNFPREVIFDGANVWISNANNNNTVTKLRVSDGATLGTFSVGRDPERMAFDGVNIWVGNNQSNSLTKLRASDGKRLATCNVGNGPNGVAFAGTNIWVANGADNTVWKLRATDCSIEGTFNVPNPDAIAFDGANIWVTNYQGSNTVTKLRATDGAVLGTFGVGSNPVDIAFDGVNMWAANYQSSNVTKLDASTGNVLGTFAIEGSATRLIFDGANIWITGNNSATVSRIRASDQSRTRVGPNDDTTAAHAPSPPNKSAHECIWCEGGPHAIAPHRRDPQATNPKPTGSGIRSIDFSNFEYRPDCLQKPIRVSGGKWKEVKENEENYFRVASIAYGDLKGDGKDEAVVLGACGGAANFEMAEVFVFEMSRLQALGALEALLHPIQATNKSIGPESPKFISASSNCS
jgi:hypothetical protein